MDEPAIRRGGGRGCTIALLALLALLGLALAWAVPRGVRAAQALLRLQNTLREAQALMGAEDLPTDPGTLRHALTLVHTARQDLDVFLEAADPLLALAPYLGWVPRWGGDLTQAPHLVEMGQHLAYALDALVPFGNALLDLQEQGPLSLDGLLSLLVAHRPALERATEAAEAALAARETVAEETLSPHVRALLGQADPYLPLLGEALALAETAPDLLGAEGERQYLLLAQNADELRATGGFISGVGLLTLWDGKVVGLTFTDSYAVDDLSKPHPAAPPALTRYMLGAGLLLLRDVNWWPDFPTVAQAAEALYELDQGIVTDGVVAADLEALRQVLEVLGPVHLPGYGETVDAANLVSLLKAYWAAPKEAPALGEKPWQEWWQHRKDVMGDVLGAVFLRLSTGEVDWPSLLRALLSALEEKHILVYLNHPQAQAAVARMGWDGALRTPEQGDFLMVVDTNVGFNKVNPMIQEAITYTVRLDGSGGAEAELSIRYFHRATKPITTCVQEARYGDSYDEMQERCYWDYLRVLVPPGTEVLAHEGLEEGTLEVLQEDRRYDILAGLLILKPQEARTVRLVYRLPPGRTAAGPYHLLVQKQAGTHALSFTLRVEGPGGILLCPEPLRARLRTDLEFTCPPPP
ncbi:MAG: DUF4012 domain-containing protein [Anaerolineae bacterium]